MSVGGTPSHGPILSETKYVMKDVYTAFGKGQGTRNVVADVLWIIKNAKEYKKEVSIRLVNYRKAFRCVNHVKL